MLTRFWGRFRPRMGATPQGEFPHRECTLWGILLQRVLTVAIKTPLADGDHSQGRENVISVVESLIVKGIHGGPKMSVVNQETITRNEIVPGAVNTTDSSSTPQLILAEGCQLNAEAMSWCLSAYGTFRNIQSAGSVEEVRAAIRTQRPAIVLVGERVVTEGTRELLSELAVKMGETKVAVFADDLTDRQLDLIVNNRVSGLLSRQGSMRQLNDCLLQILGGTPVLSSQLSQRIQLSPSGQFQCVASSHLKKLTDRQWDVLLRIAEGRRVSEVATDLEISSKAVESHKYRIMKTIGASDRVGLCRWAIREGLIEA